MASLKVKRPIETWVGFSGAKEFPTAVLTRERKQMGDWGKEKAGGVLPDGIGCDEGEPGGPSVMRRIGLS